MSKEMLKLLVRVDKVVFGKTKKAFIKQNKDSEQDKGLTKCHELEYSTQREKKKLVLTNRISKFPEWLLFLNMISNSNGKSWLLDIVFTITVLILLGKLSYLCVRKVVHKI